MRRALTAILLAILPAAAAAQEGPLSVDEEEPIPDPNVPDPNLPPDPRERSPAYRYEKRDYPREVVLRPLTLAAEQVEVTLDMPFVLNDSHPTLHQVLRAAYGVTVDLQLGLTYAVGLERLNARAGEDGFEVGKAVSLDGAYTILPGFLAAQARLAFYADPDVFGLGLILGVPVKITFGDRWALFGGADLVSIKLKGFAVNPSDPAANLAAVADSEREVVTSAGSIDLTAGVAFQAQPNVALFGTFGVSWPDFDTDNQPFSLFAGVSYTPRRFWDIGARLGFLSLADASESFSVAAFAAVRL